MPYEGKQHHRNDRWNGVRQNNFPKRPEGTSTVNERCLLDFIRHSSEELAENINEQAGFQAYARMEEIINGQ